MSEPVENKRLLQISDLKTSDIETLIDRSLYYFEKNREKLKGNKLLAGLTAFNLFFENSTRTLMSFEVAGKRMGMDVVAFGTETSSLKKGETLADTVRTLDAMGPAVMIVRHSESNAVEKIADIVSCAVVNAGDGNHAHPTQALLDAATIIRKRGSVKDLNVAICGDILHSRVARSNITLLSRLGANVHIVGPEELLPESLPETKVRISTDFDTGLKDMDIIMMLRIQKERISDGRKITDAEYFERFGLTRKRLETAKPDALVMHPGPINRGVEIADDVADDKMQSVILQQVEMGVATRMAVLEWLLDPIIKV